jgi:hypothetical protein
MSGQSEKKIKSHKRSFMGVTFKLGFLAFGLYHWARDVITLARQEAQIARKNLAVILVLFMSVFFFFGTAWVALQGLIGVWLVSSLLWPLASAMLIILLFNLFLLLVAVIMIAKFRKNLLFMRTRRKLMMKDRF